MAEPCWGRQGRLGGALAEGCPWGVHRATLHWPLLLSSSQTPLRLDASQSEVWGPCSLVLALSTREPWWEHRSDSWAFLRREGGRLTPTQDEYGGDKQRVSGRDTRADSSQGSRRQYAGLEVMPGAPWTPGGPTSPSSLSTPVCPETCSDPGNPRC